MAWQGKRAWLGELTVYSTLNLVGPLVGATAAIFAIWIGIKNDERLRILETPYEYVFERWKEENTEFIEAQGDPGESAKPISILWYQFFETGYILYYPSRGKSIVLNFKDESWEEIENDSEILISLYDKGKIDESRLKQLYAGPRQGHYLDLFADGKITGGIGNLYVKNDLGPRLGKPLKAEMWIEDSGFVVGEKYNLIVGIINRHIDRPDTRTRAVYALLKDQTYKRFVTFNRPNSSRSILD